jgi:hypothetical protein
MSSVDAFFTRLEDAGGVRLGTEQMADPRTWARDLAEFRRDPAFIAAGGHADPMWLEFLERDGGATVEVGHHQVVLFGFDDRVTFHLLHGEGSLIDADGFMAFAVISLERPSAPLEERYLDIGYSFDTTGRRRAGVYQRIDNRPITWFAPSFADWLERVGAVADDLEQLARAGAEAAG